MLEEHATLNKFDLLTDKSVLHFAPEPVLRDKIKKLAGNYVTADYFALGYHYPDIDLNLDIAAMPSIKSESIDCLIACDVLEHVADDQKALLEINRVLSKGGVCLITVPQRDGFDKTETDLSPMTPEQREKRFGQFDHYRIYGSDFVEQMSQAGFHVQVVDEKHFSNEVVERHVLFPPELSKHPLATNFRKVFVGIKH
ncbi:MAG: methyltransferase domain-containing protein [Bacteroidota bacterium]